MTVSKDHKMRAQIKNTKKISRLLDSKSILEEFIICKGREKVDFENPNARITIAKVSNCVLCISI